LTHRKKVKKLSVVPARKLNTSLNEVIQVKKQPKVTLICAGRSKPSKEAVKKFTNSYLEMIRNIEAREVADASDKYKEENGKEG
jgi:glucan phosphorylase